MTREEAIGILVDEFKGKDHLDSWEQPEKDEFEKYYEALNMAIEALKAHCEDAVSRADVLRYLERTYHSGLGKQKSYEYNKKFVSMMPSVQPIPVMYYPQVTGVTPYVVAEDMKGGEQK